MKIPFVYGKTAEAEDFTGREKDIARLKANLQGGINTILISPRRWGKTSLVNQVMKELEQDSNYLVCKVDVFNCRSEEDFYKAFLNAVLNASSSKLTDFIELVKKYMGSVGPKFTVSDVGATTSFSIGMDFKEKHYSVDEILSLPEKIAKEKEKNFIISIDEFQHIDDFDDPRGFQAKLRAHWQVQQHCCYCLYGSKRHMLLSMFGDYEMPFYKFGDMMMLDKIPLQEWVEFIVRRFNQTGKCITPELAKIIAERVECHSFYVQQYSQLVWLLTNKTASMETVDLAYEQLIDRSSLVYSNLIDNLKPRQINFLLSIAHGEKNFSSAKTLRDYNLGTSANVKNLKKAVIERDLVDLRFKDDYEIQDPVLKEWLLRNYTL